jgi:hypothetical protein
MGHTDYSIKNASVKAKLSSDTAGSLIEFGDAIDVVQLASTFETVERKPVSGNNSSTIGPIKDTINVTFGDSLKTGEFWLFLRNNHGEKIDVEFSPKAGGTAMIAATCTATTPGSFGGAQGYNAATASLPCEGTATITPEAA